jgi:hypothetical protein
MTARLLLVHSPLVGPSTWELVARELTESGYDTAVVDLTGTVVSGPPYGLRQAQLIARDSAGRPTILIGHSGAGPLLPAAGMIIGRVLGYIFVDAGLPTPGQSWMDAAPLELAEQLKQTADDKGWLPAWPDWWSDAVLHQLLPDPATRQHFVQECPRLPLDMFEEVRTPVAQWPDAPAGYLQLSEGYQKEATRARELGWPVAEQPSHHLAMVTEPGRIAKSLRELIGQLVPG